MQHISVFFFSSCHPRVQKYEKKKHIKRKKKRISTCLLPQLEKPNIMNLGETSKKKKQLHQRATPHKNKNKLIKKSWRWNNAQLLFLSSISHSAACLSVSRQTVPHVILITDNGAVRREMGTLLLRFFYYYSMFTSYYLIISRAVYALPLCSLCASRSLHCG